MAVGSTDLPSCPPPLVVGVGMEVPWLEVTAKAPAMACRVAGLIGGIRFAVEPVSGTLERDQLDL